MFQRVVATDTKLIISGLIILITIVTVGVGIVEHQLAVLTQRPVHERLFYLGRNEDHRFFVCVFGYSMDVDGIFPKTTILQSGDSVDVAIGHHSIKLPIRTEAIRLPASYWFTIWHKQFVNEAQLAKRTAGEYWRQIKPYIEAVFQRVKIKTQQAAKELEEYIHEYR